jgi:alkyl hydroperoxide reductase subunit D
MTLNDVKAALPDWAKDIRLNLDATIARSSLEPRLAAGAALAAAYAARSPALVAAFRDPSFLDRSTLQAR